MEASKRVASIMLRTVAVVVIFVLINGLYTLYRGGNLRDSSIAFTETQISFSDASGQEIVIVYSDVRSMELLDAPDYGAPDGGTIENKTRLGTWSSTQLGTYITHTSTEIPNCILLRTDSAAYAVNYENEQTTALLFEELKRYQ